MDRLDEYRTRTEEAGIIWREHGALEFLECMGDDLDTVEMVSFSNLARAQEDEVVILSWIVFKSREHRDEVNAKVMADPRFQTLFNPRHPIIDSSRMAYGGFTAIAEA